MLVSPLTKPLPPGSSAWSWGRGSFWVHVKISVWSGPIHSQRSTIYIVICSSFCPRRGYIENFTLETLKANNILIVGFIQRWLEADWIQSSQRGWCEHALSYVTHLHHQVHSLIVHLQSYACEDLIPNGCIHPFFGHPNNLKRGSILIFQKSLHLIPH
jgi:hypothetical protein